MWRGSLPALRTRHIIGGLPNEQTSPIAVSKSDELLSSLSDDQKADLLRRILSKTNLPLTREGHSNWCKPWMYVGSLDRDGYPVMGYKGVKLRVHRAMLFLYLGELPPVTRHLHPGVRLRRDVNPRRLVAGTQAENVADRDRQGRTAKGESNGRSKLTQEEVAAIKGRLSEGAAKRQLAREYGVDRTTIRDIDRGRIWKHVAPATTSRRAA